MHFKAESCEAEALYKHDPETLPPLWAKGHLKWSEAKWKTVLWSDKSTFEILFVNHGLVLLSKEERDHPACYQWTVQKLASLMVWGCMRAYGVGSLHIWNSTINAEQYIEVLEQHMLPVSLNSMFLDCVRGTEESGGNLHKHRENMQTQHRKTQLNQDPTEPS